MILVVILAPKGLQGLGFGSRYPETTLDVGIPTFFDTRGPISRPEKPYPEVSNTADALNLDCSRFGALDPKPYTLNPKP